MELQGQDGKLYKGRIDKSEELSHKVFLEFSLFEMNIRTFIDANYDIEELDFHLILQTKCMESNSLAHAFSVSDLAKEARS